MAEAGLNTSGDNMASIDDHAPAPYRSSQKVISIVLTFLGVNDNLILTNFCILSR
jgi:hypothetical protein